MNLKKSFFSKILIYNNIKRFWWIMALYTVYLLLASPLLILTRDLERIQRGFGSINFSLIFNSTVVSLIVLPVLIGTIVFRYMQSPKSMVALHSMPYTRLQLYVNNIASGLILSLVPILINTAALSCVKIFTDFGPFIDYAIVMKYLGLSTIITISLLSWTILVGMFTGSSVAQIIFTYILNFLPLGLVAGINYLLIGVIYGFCEVSDSTLESVALFSPIMQMILEISNSTSLQDFWWIDCIMVAFVLVAGYFIYKFRNLETATDVISGKLVKPVFKYGVTVCVMIVGTLYIKGVFDTSAPNLMIYLAFALLGYVIAEMLLRKSFKIWNSYKGFVGFIGVFAIVTSLIYFDAFGIEKYVPDINEVDCASLESYNVKQFKNSTMDNPASGALYSRENIEKVLKLNKLVVDNRKIAKAKLEDDYYASHVNISYKLKNGKIVRKNYFVPDDDTYKEYVEMEDEIYDAVEYKTTTNPLFKYEVGKLENIVIRSVINEEGDYIVVSEPEDMKNLLEVVKSDIIELSTDERSEYNDIYIVDFKFKEKKHNDDGNIYPVATTKYGSDYERYYFNKNAGNMTEYIEDKNYHDKLFDSESVIRISFYKGSSNSEDILKKEITDKAAIREVIDLLPNTKQDIDYEKNNEAYYVSVYTFSGVSNFGLEGSSEIVEKYIK